MQIGSLHFDALLCKITGDVL